MTIKKLLCTFLSLIICLTLTVKISATEQKQRLIDDARLLTSSEKEELNARLDEISERQKLDVIILTVDSTDGRSPGNFANSYYDSNALGYKDTSDGVMLMLSMEDRDWYITAGGTGREYFTVDGCDHIGKKIVDGGLEDDEYIEAFLLFASLCDEFITQGKTGEPYDYSNLPKDPFDVTGTLIISLVIGIIAAFIITQTMRSRLKTVRPQTRAEEYIKHGSMNITRSHDFFLYRVVNRRPRPKSNSSGSSRSSGGRGSGGKF